MNVAPAADLRRQLMGALGQDVALGLLVARAAGRHADTLGLGTVALQDLTAGEARTVRPGALRDALAALGTLLEGTPDLLVTDAGTLDLDDLHLGHTVTLSVGRERGPRRPEPQRRRGPRPGRALPGRGGRGPGGADHPGDLRLSAVSDRSG